MITLKDVAKRANVSLATASYSINGNKKIKKETRDKVIKAAKDLGYIPNALARGLMLNQTKKIGFVIPNVAIPYYASIVQHIEKEFKKKGYYLLLGISNFDTEYELKIVKSFIESRTDGIIIDPGLKEVNDEHLKTYKKLLKNNKILFIDYIYPGLDRNYIINDWFQGAYDMTMYLLKKQYTNIVFFGSINDKRYKGHIKAYQDNELDISNSSFVQCGFTFDAAYKKISEWLDENKTLPDAFMLTNDEMALGVLKFLKENKIDVPNDVAVVGYDDIIFPKMTEINLTTVRVPIKEMCKQAAKTLISSIENDDDLHSKKVILQTKLIKRNSS